MALLALSITPFAEAFAAPHDFDGDGVSDISIVSIQNGGTLQWRNFLVGSSSSEIAAESFGEAGNNLINAPWTSTTTSQIGIVSQDAEGNIVWKLADGTANETQGKTFGIKKNFVMSGGDFNGNGFADAAIVRGSTFIIQTDFFANIAQQVKRSKRAKIAATELRMSLKRKGDIPFFASPDGTSDWIAVLREVKRVPGEYRVILRDPVSGQRRSVKLGLVNGSKAPLPVRRTTGGDYLAFSSVSDGRTTLSFKDMTGATVSSFTVDGDGEILVGEYSLQHTGYEVAVQGDDVFTVVSPDAGPLGTINPPEGIAVDHVNITRFTEDGSGGGGGSGGGNGSDEYLNPRDGGWGFLWKPESDSNGRLVILFPPQFTGQLTSCDLVNSSGAVIETGQYAGSGNGQTPTTPREHFRFSDPGGKYPVNVVVRGNLKNGGSVNYIIDKPGSRID